MTTMNNEDPADPSVHEPRDMPHVLKHLARYEVGSCNACTEPTHKTVTEIRLRNMSVRLCDECLKVLKWQL